VTNTPTITGHTQLTAEQLRAVEQLGHTVRAAGIDPRLNVEWLAARDGARMADWLAWDGTTLVGIASTQQFDTTAEATLALLPDAPIAVAEALYTRLCEALPRQGATRLLLLHDRAASQLHAFAQAHGLLHDHAEQLMRRPHTAGMPQPVSSQLTIVRAQAAELPGVAAVLASGWGGDPAAVHTQIEQSMQRGNISYYLASAGEQSVATLNVQILEGQPWIYGLVVLAAFRSQGYARQLLSYALSDVLAHGPTDTFLEVEPENTPAVRLYHSFGFAVQRTFDYWEKELPDGSHP
jgi:ribosomal protein S18 acetylase RimI-like enzyme